MKRLFLDDMREPKEAFPHTRYQTYLDDEWIVVRSYKEFTDWILSNGLPDIVSFDHDLKPEHYTPEEFWTDYHASEAWQSANVTQGETGADCAKWLVGYCGVMKLNTPKFLVHSQNPVGRDRIFFIMKMLEFAQGTYKF